VRGAKSQRWCYVVRSLRYQAALAYHIRLRGNGHMACGYGARVSHQCGGPTVR
jgi:hypothetical protein